MRSFFQLVWYNLTSTFIALSVVFLIILLSVFWIVVFSEDPQVVIGRLGIKGMPQPKFEALKFLGIGMGGVLIALQALVSYRRAKALEKTAEAQADTAKAQAETAKAQVDTAKAQTKAVVRTEDGQRQDRLKNAIEHLGHGSGTVRLGGAYELFHLAEDTVNLRSTILRILCAHIRRTTSQAEYRDKNKSRPSEEIQSLLNFLCVQNHEVFSGLPIELHGGWLNGADFSSAKLKRANFRKAHLRNAEFSDAQLQESNLTDTFLREAEFFKAELGGACLRGARVPEAGFMYANLRGADLNGAVFWGARLGYSMLQGSNLFLAELHEADLGSADFRGVYSSFSASPFEVAIRSSIGKDSDFSYTALEGGLYKHRIDQEELSAHLKSKLMPHVDIEKSNRLSEDRKATTGNYSRKEAETWIQEHKTAMTDFS